MHGKGCVLKAGSSKNKGNTFEREVSKSLSLWVSEGEDPHVFWRSASSGAKATVNAKFKGIKDFGQCGDIASVSSRGSKFIRMYFIELKFYKNLHMESFIYGKPEKNSILEFWKKTQVQALEYDKIPLMIVKQNNQKIMMLTDYIGMSKMRDWWGSPDFYVQIPNYALYIFEFDWLLKKCTPFPFK